MTDKSSSSAGGWTLATGLSIFLHSNANFSDEASPIKCVDSLNLVTRFEMYTQCPNATGVRYVTIQRASYQSASVQLGLQEVAIYRSSEKRATACSWARQ